MIEVSFGIILTVAFVLIFIYFIDFTIGIVATAILAWVWIVSDIHIVSPSNMQQSKICCVETKNVCIDPQSETEELNLAK